jgi:hypothetical protein
MGIGLQALGDEGEVYIPQQTAEAEEDHTALDGAVCGAEEVGNGPDFVRVEDEAEQLVSKVVDNEGDRLAFEQADENQEHALVQERAHGDALRMLAEVAASRLGDVHR